MSLEKYYMSPKGVKYILSPKRGMCTDINSNVAQTLTARGHQSWTGSFISPDIEYIEKSTTIGSQQPTVIHLVGGQIMTSNDNISNLRIRKLTPREYWRLMGFDDEDFDKASAVSSENQLYKQAGNSICVNVLEAIIKNLLVSRPQETMRQMTIFDFIERG